jgi:hypothetical protein
MEVVIAARIRGSAALSGRNANSTAARDRHAAMRRRSTTIVGGEVQEGPWSFAVGEQEVCVNGVDVSDYFRGTIFSGSLEPTTTSIRSSS